MIQFWLIIRGRDCTRTIPRTLKSLRQQTHGGWDACVHLDGGPQSAVESVYAWRGNNLVDLEVESWSEHWGVAGNLYRALESLRESYGPSGTSVVAILDGDGDTLPKDALRRVAHVYEKYPDTLVTYGSYKKKSKGDRTKISQPYPKGADVRTYPWHASHLKTFRASLLPYVKPEWFQDKNGKWLQAASDVALMLPLMELAGLDRCRHIHEITYVWNDSPVSKEKRALQKRCEAIVRSKPREQRLS